MAFDKKPRRPKKTASSSRNEKNPKAEERSVRTRSAGEKHVRKPEVTSPRKVVKDTSTLPLKPDVKAPRENIIAPIARRSGALPVEKLPVILGVEANDDYALLDSGDGLKLEQYGPHRIIRPEGQALWRPNLGRQEWENVDAIFTGDRDEEGVGRWQFPKTILGETWPMTFDGLHYYGRFTSFRHVGVFPEQASHWRDMEARIKGANRPIKVLNLFGYTGVASLVAARAGAHVTHVDASKKAIGWARENQKLAGLDDKPIRWICEDAMKFIEREARRGSRYDLILTDPPAFGRGPKGEIWQLFDHLPAMLDGCRTILSHDPLALVLTSYSIRASFFTMHALMRDLMAGMGGCVQSGELIIREAGAGRSLSTSLYSRWES